MSQAAEQTTMEWKPPEGGRRWTIEDAREMAKAFEESGETLAAFSRRYRLTPERLSWWLKRLGYRSPQGPRSSAAPPVTFMPVRVVPSPVSPRKKETEAAPTSAGMIEVILTGGQRVRVGGEFDENLLRRVVATLEDRQC